MSKTQNNTQNEDGCEDVRTEYQVGDQLYNDDVEQLERVFSAKSDGHGRFVATLFKTNSGQYLHTTHNADTHTIIDDVPTRVHRVVQTGSKIETTLQPEDLDVGAEIGYLVDDWPVYDATWRGRTISVSTDLGNYSGLANVDFRRIRDAGDLDVTFDIKLVSASASDRV